MPLGGEEISIHNNTRFTQVCVLALKVAERECLEGGSVVCLQEGDAETIPTYSKHSFSH